jgi:uncharacterized protein YacL
MSERSKTAPRGRIVEFTRLIFIALLATAGFEISLHIGEVSTPKTLLSVFLGAATGYVIGGVFGRLTASAASGVERDLRRRPAAEIASATVGLILGLVIAFLLSFPFFRLPPAAGWPLVAFVYIVFPALGYRIGASKWEELFAMVGMKPRAVGTVSGQVQVIDTSALIDGRILDLASTGFLSGTFLIHAGVLAELQRIADSSDPGRRTRGRRGLDVLARLQRDPSIDVTLFEEEGVGDVDAALVRLAKERGGTLVTADANLAKVAEATRVPVRSVNALAAAFRVPFSPGEELKVRLVKEGREHGQAVGYLDDGTMVVVEDASRRLGEIVTASVTNMIQTPTGRMVFATLATGAGVAQ